MDVDDALSKLGRFGRWQMFTYTLVCLSVTVSGCWHMMVIVFTGGEPAHHCKVPDGQSLNETIPTTTDKRGRIELEKCKKYVNFTFSNETTHCNDGWYYAPEYDSTLVTEWDLVCDKNYLVETSQSVFSFGVMVGAVLFTTLADKIGRKPVHLGCQWGMIAVGFAIAFSPNYITFVILRFLLGAIREGAGLTGIVMACELFPAAQRTFAGTALELFWAGSWMALSLLAYLIRDWRHLQLAVTLPPILTIALIWLMPESIPWLAANHRIDEAEEILRKAARITRVSLPEPILNRPDDGNEDQALTDNKENNLADGYETFNDKDKAPYGDSDHNDVHENSTRDTVVKVTPKKQEIITRLRNLVNADSTQKKADCKKKKKHVDDENYTCIDILKSKTMLLYTSIMCSLWFASGVVYFGLSLSTSTLAGDKYINFFLSGAVEAPAYLLTVFVLQKYGRRWPLCIFHMVAGVVLCANVFIPEVTESGTDLTALIITLTMIGKFAMTAAFGTVVLYAPEIYPTNMRNMGFGLASVWGRIGGMIAPFAAYIGKIIPWIPGIGFTVISISTGMLALLLPETLNRPLPETIEEVEAWTRTIPELSKPLADGEHKDCEENQAVLIRDRDSKPSSEEATV